MVGGAVYSRTMAEENGESAELQTCPARGAIRRQCGRPLHRAPSSVDETPVCLLHSKDPGKRTAPLFEVFRRGFEEAIAIAEAWALRASPSPSEHEDLEALAEIERNATADFEGFVFPPSH
jgi:hypothetical protein